MLIEFEMKGLGEGIAPAACIISFMMNAAMIGVVYARASTCGQAEGVIRPT